VTVSEIDIPVSYSAAFEGEGSAARTCTRIRGKNALGIGTSGCARWTRSRDGKIEVIGPDIDTITRAAR